MNFDALLSTLPIMGKGMLAIFIVIGVIIGIMYILGAVSNRNENK